MDILSGYVGCYTGCCLVTGFEPVAWQ